MFCSRHSFDAESAKGVTPRWSAAYHVACFVPADGVETALGVAAGARESMKKGLQPMPANHAAEPMTLDLQGQRRPGLVAAVGAGPMRSLVAPILQGRRSPWRRWGRIQPTGSSPPTAGLRRSGSHFESGRRHAPGRSAVRGHCRASHIRSIASSRPVRFCESVRHRFGPCRREIARPGAECPPCDSEAEGFPEPPR